jgi:hypothetical protein
MTEVLIMPMPAVWAAALVNDNIESLLPADRIDCQVMIEQLRNDGYAVIGLAHNAQPRLTNQYRLYGGNTDSGMVLDYLVHGGQPTSKERDGPSAFKKVRRTRRW